MTKLPRYVRRRLYFIFSVFNTSLIACHYNLFTLPSYVYRCVRFYHRYGFTPEEALKLGLYHLKTPINEAYISKKHLLVLQRMLNHPSLQSLTEEKSLFYLHCLQLGIPVPQLIAIVPQLIAIFCNNASGMQVGGGPLHGEEQWTHFFDTDCPNRFIIKPSYGVYGNDILFIDKTNPSFSSASLYQQLIRNTRYSSFVIQEWLENHSDLQRINPKRGLQTFRVITLVRSSDDIQVIYAFFKPIVGDNLIDNHRGGKTHNLLCPVEVATGILQDLYIVSRTSVENPEIHPDTQRALKGTVVPQWMEVLNLAKSAAKSFLPLRCIGWDIAITSKGLYIIEANSRWDPLLFGNIRAVTRPICDLLDADKPE